jgi:hypothetical protein
LGRADAKVAGRKLAGEPIHLRFARFDLALRFLHEPSPEDASYPLPKPNSLRKGYSDI